MVFPVSASTATIEIYDDDNGPIPGNRGMWAGILAEMTEFGLLFAVYFIARAHYPEAFHEGPGRLSLLAGTVNTVLMISGSYFVAKAVLAVSRGANRVGLAWLVLVLAMGVGYLVTKAFEFQWNADNGITGRSGIFYTVYYYLTFTHIVHVVWGILGLLWVMFRTTIGAYTPEEHDGLEAFASYWHATDLVWLVIFPLLYVLR